MDLLGAPANPKQYDVTGSAQPEPLVFSRRGQRKTRACFSWIAFLCYGKIKTRKNVLALIVGFQQGSRALKCRRG